MNLRLHIWRQPGPDVQGMFKTYDLDGVSEHMSFLEMLDVLNETLIGRGEEPVAFDHDCREGICGTCGMVINGRPHGPLQRTTTCQLHMRFFKDGDEIYIEPWRASAFPVVRDLVVDRSSFDRIIANGGFISVNTGNAQDGNAIPIPKPDADRAFDAAACIGCGACVAACPNSSAMLFVGAKAGHLGMLPQGQAERGSRALNMLLAADESGFGACTNHLECEAACPKGISAEFIAMLNRDYMKAAMFGRD
ncbi:MAG: succinate dehydrogenase/fumarate reductase iron-sulfur subunit [Candidatus Kapabacteria bacterium]|jgi:succinate dehydrogenase / fumarate reductase iron-sulfur subunit|nr:succinate dehydrogenase/fumarate reductase iron-sulfur subunit [Candidatus Kapabacteria bacterium]